MLFIGELNFIVRSKSIIKIIDSFNASNLTSVFTIFFLLLNTTAKIVVRNIVLLWRSMNKKIFIKNLILFFYNLGKKPLATGKTITIILNKKYCMQKQISNT